MEGPTLPLVVYLLYGAVCTCLVFPLKIQEALRHFQLSHDDDTLKMIWIGTFGVLYWVSRVLSSYDPLLSIPTYSRKLNNVDLELYGAGSTAKHCSQGAFANVRERNDRETGEGEKKMAYEGLMTQWASVKLGDWNEEETEEEEVRD
ncbi:hypothetical protein BS50DRAFT_647321 [Corynespora cassiicola Philippines]|uniref:Uncharacterized protein n=1 Tax=Corynespora cassiicola Philippines TaxID=1448308 RepID=A0A2T2NE02_CORCC|nr:hypothetical protein BS50DRAFT_647321 [Corynespora cassiicola Philippines]